MNNIATILGNIQSDIVWPVFAGLSIVMFLYAGILFLTAQGEPGKLTKAKDAVIWGLIGVAIGIASSGAIIFIKGILAI